MELSKCILCNFNSIKRIFLGLHNLYVTKGMGKYGQKKKK